MVDECVVAVYPTVDQATAAVRGLVDDGFPAAQVSLVTVGLQNRPEVVEELKLGDDAVYEAAVGAGMGGALGMLTGLVAMAAAGPGAIFLLGPMSSGIIGAIVGAYVGAVSGSSAHQQQIHHYQQLLESGQALVVAQGDPVELLRAQQQLEDSGATEVHNYARSEDEPTETA